MLILIPIFYIVSNWQHIPEIIPLHYNFYGEVDKTGGKINLIYLATFIPLGVYIILLVAEFIDPKNKISDMGRRYLTIRFLLSILLAALIFMFTYSIINQTAFFQNAVFILIGLLFVFLGNYFGTLKPNYFIGFRTPWTLENEEVWRKTHRHCSKVWFIGGLLIIIANMLNDFNSVWALNVVCIISLIVIPIVYSYSIYKKVTTKPDQNV